MEYNWQPDSRSMIALQQKGLRHLGRCIGVTMLALLVIEWLLWTFAAPLEPVLTLLFGESGITALDGILYSILMLLTLLIGCFLTDAKSSHIFPSEPLREDYAFFATGIAMGAAVLSNFLSNLVCSYLESSGMELSTYQPVQSFSMGEALLGFLFSVCIPALLEELIFRGLILQSLRRFGDQFAAVTSALLFALFHTTPGQMIPAFIIGYCMAVFCIRAGSLSIAHRIHFLNNLISEIEALLLAMNAEEAFDSFFLLVTVGSLIWMLVGIIGMRRRYGSVFGLHQQHGCILTAGEKTLTLLTCLPLLVASVLYLATTFA